MKSLYEENIGISTITPRSEFDLITLALELTHIFLIYYNGYRSLNGKKSFKKIKKNNNVRSFDDEKTNVIPKKILLLLFDSPTHHPPPIHTQMSDSLATLLSRRVVFTEDLRAFNFMRQNKSSTTPFSGVFVPPGTSTREAF